jgi:hypothetical protein
MKKQTPPPKTALEETKEASPSLPQPQVSATTLERQGPFRPPGAFSIRPGGAPTRTTSTGSWSHRFLQAIRSHRSSPPSSNRRFRGRSVTEDDHSWSSSSSDRSIGTLREYVEEFHVPVAELVSPTTDSITTSMVDFHSRRWHDIEIAQEVYPGTLTTTTTPGEEEALPSDGSSNDGSSTTMPDGTFSTPKHDTAGRWWLCGRRRRQPLSTETQFRESYSVRLLHTAIAVLVVLVLALVVGLLVLHFFGSSSSSSSYQKYKPSGGNNGHVPRSPPSQEFRTAPTAAPSVFHMNRSNETWKVYNATNANDQSTMSDQSHFNGTHANNTDQGSNFATAHPARDNTAGTDSNGTHGGSGNEEGQGGDGGSGNGQYKSFRRSDNNGRNGHNRG